MVARHLRRSVGPGLDDLTMDRLIDQTIDACNSCHVATGSAFITVRLDASDTLSLRHPHALTPREAPGGHHHGVPTQMEPMMQQMEQHMMEGAPHQGAEEPHADEDKHRECDGLQSPPHHAGR